jgi:hypothetical protein
LFNEEEQAINIYKEIGKFLRKISLENIDSVSKKWTAIATLYDEQGQIINRN